jgi:hypothetical protein
MQAAKINFSANQASRKVTHGAKRLGTNRTTQQRLQPIADRHDGTLFFGITNCKN